VGLFSLLITIIITGITVYYSNNIQIDSIKSILNLAAQDTLNSKEDEFSVALNVTESSKLPIAANVISSDKSISYLVENSASINVRPSGIQLTKSLTSPVAVEGHLLIRSIKTDEDQYLVYSMSIEIAQNNSTLLIKHLLDVLVILLPLLMICAYIYFRKDSAINAGAKALDLANKRMKEFIGDASHELRTPLTVIKGYSELIQKDPASDKSERYLENQGAEIRKMEKLIEKLLLLAEVGERVKAIEDVNLTNILERQVERLRDLFPEREITSDFNEIIFKSDFEMIDTLISNIFSNISRHTSPTDAVKVQAKSGKRGLVITVEDAGLGIHNVEHQIFSRFDRSRSRETGGSGLGMSLITRISESLGGSAKFSRSDLGGLKVIISLP
jgi:signal transduction histidine kinase